MKLDPSRVSAANAAFMANHPERVNGPISADEPGFKQLSAEWNSLYKDTAPPSDSSGSGGGDAVPGPGALSTSDAGAEPEASGDPTPAPPLNGVASCPKAAGKPMAQSSADPSADPGPEPSAGPSAGPKSGSGKDSSGPSQPNSKKEKDEPCDFDVFTINCKHIGTEDSLLLSKRKIKNVKIWVEDGTEKDNYRPIPPYSTRISTKAFEVIGADTAGSGDNVKIKLEGGPGYCGEETHPWLMVYDREGSKYIKQEKGTPTTQFEALSVKIPHPFSETSGLAYIYYFYLPQLLPRTYDVTATSCRHRTDDDYSRSLSNKSIVVRAYPSDTYKFSIELQPHYKREHKTENMNGPGGVYSEEKSNSTTKDGIEQKTTKSSEFDPEKSEGTTSNTFEYTSPTEKLTASTSKTTSYDGGPDTSKASLAFEDTNPEGKVDYLSKNLKFTRNGSDISPCLAVLELILHTVQHLSDTVQEISTLLHKFQPKVGWFMEWEYKLLAGAFDHEWGWKEYTDHTAFPWWKAHVALTIIEGKISFNYGLKVGEGEKSTGAWLFLEAVGGIKLEGDGEADVDQDVLIHGGLAGELAGSAGMNAQVLGEVAFLKVKGTTGIKGDAGKITASRYQPLSVTFELVWTGIEGVVTVGMTWKKLGFDLKHTFFEPRSLGSWTYPPEEKLESETPVGPAIE